MIATLLCAGQAEMLAQGVKQRRSHVESNAMLTLINL
jgi:hypothetical protein